MVPSFPFVAISQAKNKLPSHLFLFSFSYRIIPLHNYSNLHMRLTYWHHVTNRKMIKLSISIDIFYQMKRLDDTIKKSGCLRCIASMYVRRGTTSYSKNKKAIENINACVITTSCCPS